jgi:hypothetical protein
LEVASYRAGCSSRTALERDVLSDRFVDEAVRPGVATACVRRRRVMRVRTVVFPAVVTLAVMSGLAFAQKTKTPEIFTANLNVAESGGGAAAGTIQIEIKRYTPDADRIAVEEALKTGGYAAFLEALRKAPQVGAVSVRDRQWPIRWARERSSGEYTRTIVVVTDQPMFFVGGGRVDAKPREGYEVAVIQMEVDNVGMGKGTMTAAARVKPGGETGVQIDDYAEAPIKLVTIVRKFQ